jgi:hypothetical protein
LVSHKRQIICQYGKWIASATESGIVQVSKKLVGDATHAANSVVCCGSCFFSLLLGGLVGSFWERMRNDRRNGSGPNDTNRREKL